MHSLSEGVPVHCTNCFKAAHIFSRSNLSGPWLWNLLGLYSRVLECDEVLEYNSENECHILCVCGIFFLDIFND